MSEVDHKKIDYRNLSKEACDGIIDVLNTLPYTEEDKDTQILPYLAQWLYDKYINIESTCYIISGVTNITRLQEQIDNIYNKHIPPLTWKTHLSTFLTNNEYTKLENVVDPREMQGVLKGEIDADTNILVNFNLKRIYQEKISKSKDIPNKLTPVIEAVPEKLEVIDTLLLDQPRTFKIWWKSNVTQRVFVTAGEGTGATISEIEQYLINAGFSHSPRLVSGALSCTINTLIENKMAIIKQDIDNPGFYYDINEDKAIIVKKDFTKPTQNEIRKCIGIIKRLTSFFSNNLETLSTVLKWGLMAEFSYAYKQTGKWIPWLYLKGSAGSGKTTLAKIILFLYGIPSPETNVGGSSADTVARLGALISQSCDPRIVNEPAAVFNRNSTKEMVKVCVESTTGRSKYRGAYYGGIPAFSAILFTANQYLPEDDALIRRLYVLSFTYSQRKSEHDRKMFEEAFHIDTPINSPLQDLKYLGRFALRHLLAEPSKLLDDWKLTADEIIKSFFDEVDEEVPKWLTLWAESESLDDFDDGQREDLRNFFVNEFNKARKRVIVQDEMGVVRDDRLYMDEASTKDDFSSINWGIINNRMFTWAIPHVSRNGTPYVCLTQGLRKSIASEVNFCSDLKSIAELLGWEYKNNKFSNGKQMKVIKVRFEEFMEFMYPNIELED